MAEPLPDAVRLGTPGGEAAPAPVGREQHVDDLRHEAQRVQADTVLGAGLLAVDFMKIYDVYIYQLQERSASARIFVATLSVPFVVISALGLTSKMNLSEGILHAIRELPNLYFIVFLLTGLAGVIPFHRFVAAHCQSYKMSRYMNHFRRLYCHLLSDKFKRLAWTPGPETNADVPVPKLQLHWAPSLMLVMGFTNSSYIGFGIALGDPSPYYLGAIVAFLVSLYLHCWIGRSEFEIPAPAPNASGGG